MKCSGHLLHGPAPRLAGYEGYGLGDRGRYAVWIGGYQFDSGQSAEHAQHDLGRGDVGDQDVAKPVTLQIIRRFQSADDVE